MNTQTVMNDEQVKDEILNLFLVSLGEAICKLMSDADFQRIRTLKGAIDEMFLECDRAVQASKIRAASMGN